MFNRIVLSDLNPNLFLSLPALGFPYLTRIEGNMNSIINAVASKSNLDIQLLMPGSREQFAQPSPSPLQLASSDLQDLTSVALDQSNRSSISTHPTSSVYQPSPPSSHNTTNTNGSYSNALSSLPTATRPSSSSSFSPLLTRSEQQLLKPFLRSIDGVSGPTQLIIHNDEILELFGKLPPSLQYVQIDSSPHLVMSSEYFQLLPALRVISIGEQCLQTTPGLSIHQLPSLRSVRIGSNSFKSTVSGKTGILSIRECPCLMSLTVGEGALNGCSTVVLQDLANLNEIELCAHCFPLCDLFVLRECCTLEQIVFPEQSFSSISDLQISGKIMKT